MKHQATCRPSRISDDPEFNDRFWYWQGASGTAYIHSVYRADQCPPLPGAIYIAVRRMPDGGCLATGIGRFDELSQFSGRCCDLPVAADELHLHMLARDAGDSERILRDLAAALKVSTGLDDSGGCGDRQANGFHEGQLALFAGMPENSCAVAAS